MSLLLLCCGFGFLTNTFILFYSFFPLCKVVLHVFVVVCLFFLIISSSFGLVLSVCGHFRGFFINTFHHYWEFLSLFKVSLDDFVAVLPLSLIILHSFAVVLCLCNHLMSTFISLCVLLLKFFRIPLKLTRLPVCNLCH